MRASLLAILTLLFLSLTARADTITNFNFSSDLTNGYTAQGLVSIDTTAGQVKTSFFTLKQNGIVDATFTSPDYTQPLGGAFLAEFVDSKAGYRYEMLLPDATLAGYGGGPVCTTAHTCLGYPSGVYLPNGGNAMAVDGTLAKTPEPASLVFLGTGMVLGILFKRGRLRSRKGKHPGANDTDPLDLYPALPQSVP